MKLFINGLKKTLFIYLTFNTNTKYKYDNIIILCS